MTRKPIAITLPLPSAKLSTNRRGHWSKHSAAIASARHAAKILALQAVGSGNAPQWGEGRIVLHFCWDWRGESRRRYPDRSNAVASCKPYIDGLVDAGIYEDDRDVSAECGEWGIDQENPRLVMECYGPEGATQ